MFNIFKCKLEGIIGCNKSVYGQPSFYMDKIISQLL